MPEKAENGLCGKLLQKLKAQVWPTKLVAEVDVKDIEEQVEDYSNRCQWDIIAKISPATIINVLYSALSKRHIAYRDLPIILVSQTRGSYHQVFIAKIRNPLSYQLEGWVIKIPGHGTPDRWKSDDQYMLFHEVQTMRLITTYTDVPVVEAIDYSATLDNGFGFPYIVMEELPGISAFNLWYEDHAVAPSAETEQKRLNCLRSLARHMTGLNKLRFDQIGMPIFPHPGAFTSHQDIEEERLPVGKYYVWPYCDSYQSAQRGPFSSTQHYIRDAFNNVDCLANDGTETLPRLGIKGSLDETKVRSIGTSKFLAIILSHPVFHSTPSSAFALRHLDLDLQNILTDGDGNVVGILDWDASLAAPRCVGHASAPSFLDLDFYPNALMKSPFLHWRAGHYRDIYAAALVEAGNPDAQYTSKSHIYQAVLLTIYDGNDEDDLFERLLRETGLQIDLWDAKYLLTKGCKATEEMLKKALWKVLDPQLPAENLLQCVEQQNHVKRDGVGMDG